MQRRRAVVTLEEMVEGLRVGLCPRFRLWIRMDLSASLTAATKGSALGGGKGVRTSKVVYVLRDFNDIAVA
jgi:hypothetical protein